MKNYFKAICYLIFLLPTLAFARGSLNLPTTINGWAALLLIPIAILSWRDSKIISIVSIVLLLSVSQRSFTPINYAFGGAFTVATIYILFTFPFVVYNRRKENLRLEKVAKSEVKWVRNENGIKKIGSIIFYKNEHFEITKTKKIGVKILYPNPMFIYAEEIENFYNY